jgi:D-alanine-D-alanine ligase
MNLSIGLCYDSKEEYLAAGHSKLEVAEFDDEGVIAGLEETLTGLGHRVERVGRGQALAARLLAGKRWDLIFNVAEGLRGRARESQVPALCELFDQPYTFSDPVTCGLTLDKSLAKRVVRDAGLPTPGFIVVRSLADIESGLNGSPMFVKPLAEGSSKGVSAHSIVNNRKQLLKTCTRLLPDFPDGLLVEELLPGREVTVGVVGNAPRARVVAVMEVVWNERSEVDAYTQLNKDEYLDRSTDWSRMNRWRTRPPGWRWRWWSCWVAGTPLASIFAATPPAGSSFSRSIRCPDSIRCAPTCRSWPILQASPTTRSSVGSSMQPNKGMRTKHAPHPGCPQRRRRRRRPVDARRPRPGRLRNSRARRDGSAPPCAGGGS